MVRGWLCMVRGPEQVFRGSGKTGPYGDTDNEMGTSRHHELAPVLHQLCSSEKARELLHGIPGLDHRDGVGSSMILPTANRSPRLLPWTNQSLYSTTFLEARQKFSQIVTMEYALHPNRGTWREAKPRRNGARAVAC